MVRQLQNCIFASLCCFVLAALANAYGRECVSLEKRQWDTGRSVEEGMDVCQFPEGGRSLMLLGMWNWGREMS